ncbi:protein of unknown function DUF523 [Denitrovibrio acetiphilus DSM 12809]|uniref:Uncharacterized protein n=1 Tax=Denitrovibrio acetiphilus (strain DSM 12809 / NBRC 114555 / N2460) TaxID=522772 RepID=D4H5Y6_DENA2|nr:DUF523 domain-containing protein [Denitrovibrio acetiphilus]ADD67632.1 protein of unknown function DUF523 [Denitrovibrio acetiphilus DSM 12809]
MKKILVSACLLGENVRYNAEVIEVSDKINDLMAKYEVIPVCPEVLGGLPVPREACEIQGMSGSDVLDGDTIVRGSKGSDHTGAFVIGAKKTLELAREHNVEFAVLKQRSPSCGSSCIYTGKFDGTKQPGEGVATALLRRQGIKVISEEDI